MNEREISEWAYYDNSDEKSLLLNYLLMWEKYIMQKNANYRVLDRQLIDRPALSPILVENKEEEAALPGTLAYKLILVEKNQQT